MSAIVSNEHFYWGAEPWMEAVIALTFGEIVDMDIESLNDYVEKNILDENLLNEEDQYTMTNISYNIVSCDPDNNVISVKVTADLEYIDLEY